MKKKCVLINPATGKQCSKYRDGTRRTCSMHRYREKNNRDLWTKRSRAERYGEIAKLYRMPSEEVDRLLATIDHVLVGEYVNSRTPVEARHACGRINKVTIGGIKQGYVTHGCRPCLVKNKKLLEMTHEEATKEVKAYGFTPIEEYKGMNKKWRSIHDACGEEVAPSLGNLRQAMIKGTTGCYYCQRQASADKRRATSETIATALAEQNLYPIGEYVRSGDPFQVGCNTCGRDNLMMSYGDIKQKHGCKYCNGGLFTMNPTNLYLMKNSEKKALKVGIAMKGKQTKKRLREHNNCGFVLSNTWEFETGEDAYNIEQEVLRHWREDLGNPEKGFLSKEEMWRTGHEETASMRKVGLKKTIDYIDELIAA